jgi:hypothetical protein
LFGTNSSGKTSILQLLLLLKQTVDSADRNIALDLGDNRPLVSLGTLADVLYNHDTTKPLSWSFTWEHDVVQYAEPEIPRSPPAKITFDGQVALNESLEPVVQRFAYRQGDRSIGMAMDQRGRYRLEKLPNTEWSDQPRSVGPFPRPVKSYGFPGVALSAETGILAPVNYMVQYERLFERLHYLGPLREAPQRQYIWAGGQPQGVGVKGERAVDAVLAGRGRPPTNPILETRIALALRALGLIYDFAVNEIAPDSSIYRVQVRRTKDSAEVLLPDVGFGVSQILPVIVLCYYVPEGSIILLEQPEMHLHPRAQMALADVLIDAMKVNKLQIIVESHSEHLLQRLQRRIAERSLAPSEVALYFCDQVEGASRLTPLDVNLAGGITNWPEGFFGDPLGEAVAMTKAAQAQNA